MEGLADPEAFKACYAQFRKSDNDRDVLITQLLSNYEDLKIRYQNVKNQLEDEKENREIWQRETRDARRQLHQSKLANVSPVFSLSLSLSTLPSIQFHSILDRRSSTGTLVASFGITDFVVLLCSQSSGLFDVPCIPIRHELILSN